MMLTGLFRTILIVVLYGISIKVSAEIYATKDQNGYIIYSNKNPEKNQIIFNLAPIENKTKKITFSETSQKNSNFHVSKDTQLKRDTLRRKILTTELNEETNNYTAANNRADSIDAKMHKNNIELLKKELKLTSAPQF